MIWYSPGRWNLRDHLQSLVEASLRPIFHCHGIRFKIIVVAAISENVVVVTNSENVVVAPNLEIPLWHKIIALHPMPSTPSPHCSLPVCLPSSPVTYRLSL